jgi:hypothetical protein
VNTLGNLGILARLLNSRTEIGVSQCDAALVAARGVDDLAGRYRAVRVDPVATTTTKGGGRGRRSPRSRRVPLWVKTFPLRTNCGRGVPRRVSYQDRRSEKPVLGRFGCPGRVQVGVERFRGAASLCDHPSDRVREPLRSLKSSNRSFRRGLIHELTRRTGTTMLETWPASYAVGDKNRTPVRTHHTRRMLWLVRATPSR